MFLPLTPVRCLLWAADEYGSKVGVVDGDRRFTYSEVLDRSLRLANALQAAGVGPGECAATLSFNCHQLLEAYYGVPMARAILLPLNVRLSPEEQIYILGHSGTKLVLFDPELLPIAEQIHAALPELRWIPLEPHAELPGWAEPWHYDEWLAGARPEPVDFTTIDEL
jgi:fatty-acyl-CoA synthase